MTILELAQLASKLINQKKYHTEMRHHYSTLFNKSVPAVSGEGFLFEVAKYSPLQEFYQYMAELHACNEAKTDAAILKFCELPD